MKRYADLKRRVSNLELSRKCEEVELDVDWEQLSQGEKDNIVAGARVLLRNRPPDWPHIPIDISRLSDEDKKTVDKGMQVFQKHLKPAKRESENLH